jgi:hypothetical protein
MKDVRMTLPDGTHVNSVLLTDQFPLRHIYRVLNPTGTTTADFPTLSELAAYLGDRQNVDECGTAIVVQ